VHPIIVGNKFCDTRLQNFSGKCSVRAKRKEQKVDTRNDRLNFWRKIVMRFLFERAGAEKCAYGRISVKHIFDLFIEKGSIAKTQQTLNDAGIFTKAFVTKDGKKVGGNAWTHSSLHHLLTNLAVIGKREINKKNRNISPQELPEPERYKVVEASWKPIIDEETFLRAQDLLLKNKTGTRHSLHVYRLTGIIKCGICGEMLCGQTGNGRGGKY
jgi:hypothetical protein